jgi:transposase-like protein
MALIIEIRSQNASEEFGTFVAELKTAKLRGEESVRDAVQVINRFQTKFGDSEQELKKLAKAVGVHVATLYRWKKQIEGKTTATPKSNKDQREANLDRLVNQGLITAEEKQTYLKVAAALVKKPGKPAKLQPPNLTEQEWAYVPDFLSKEQADRLYEQCSALLWKDESEPWQGEKKLAVHYGISYSKNGGPRSTEIPEIPSFLSELAEKVSNQTKHPVNYVQCHRATPGDVVRSHKDPSGMCVPMIVVGQERTFHINATEQLLEHGSLLVFNGGKTQHSMDTADKDENFNKNGREYRISLLFRYTTPSMRKFGPGPKAKAAEYKQAVQQFQTPGLFRV